MISAAVSGRVFATSSSSAVLFFSRGVMLVGSDIGTCDGPTASRIQSTSRTSNRCGSALAHRTGGDLETWFSSVARAFGHPRACGDHIVGTSERVHQPGSTPRVRGPRPSEGLRGCRCPVHPRACGDHLSSDAGRALGAGSSPRVRGPHDLAWDVAHVLRFIPARAGTTALTPVENFLSTVHPRACGDHADRYVYVTPDAGSSPRVRGPPNGNASPFVRDRFIPARAGTTLLGTSRNHIRFSRASVEPFLLGQLGGSS